MTEDELDLLASAYLDGEATSEEVSMVERDPELLARVEELRVVSERLSEPVSVAPAIKEQQLAAALAEFSSGSAVDGAEAATSEAAGADLASAGDSNVVDLTSRSRTSDGTGRSSGRRRQRDTATQAPSRSMSTWLPAAAALLLVAGGGAWVISQASGGDSFDTASVAEAGDDGESSEAADDSTEAAESAPVAMESDEAMADADTDAMEDEEEAMEDDAADDESADESDGDFDDPAGSAPAEDAEGGDGGGFFPEEPVLSFARVPALEDLPEDGPELRNDVAPSQCSATLELAEGQSINGYLPIEVAGEFAELFVVVDQNGEQSVVVVNNSCEPRP